MIFENVKKNFGFGCMRLPMKNEKVDYDQFCKMIDRFFEAGFNYFDTAHGYISGMSETAIRDCLVKRYPREKYILVDKLTDTYFDSEEDIIPFFNKQLECTGVEYFDFYLMHAMAASRYPKYLRCNAFKIAQQLKAEGKIKHIGMSFHDSAEVLDKILSEQPSIEVVQIQFNYLDMDDPRVQSEAIYEVCRKHNKPMIIMEPVKGGSLINLPGPAKKVLDDLNGGSYASYAIRFAASFEGVAMVLSGMSNTEQMEDNISYMQNFKPFIEEEYAAVKKVHDILKNEDIIQCTACRYCTDGCPAKIAIPDIFTCANSKALGKDGAAEYKNLTESSAKASDCIKCGKCEKVCPQHLKIRELLESTSKIFE